MLEKVEYSRIDEKSIRILDEGVRSHYDHLRLLESNLFLGPESYVSNLLLYVKALVDDICFG